MDNTQKMFIENLRRFRELRHFTQAKLAEESKLSMSGYTQIEYGKVWPGPETVTRIAKALSVSSSDLYSDPSKEAKTSQIETDNAPNLSPETVKAIQNAVIEVLANRIAPPRDVTPKGGLEHVKSLIDGLSYDEKISLGGYIAESAISDLDVAEPAVNERKLRG